MEGLQASTFISFPSFSSKFASRRTIKPSLQINKDFTTQSKTRNGLRIKSALTSTQRPESGIRSRTTISKAVQELYAIMDVVADRAEMHKNIGLQRDNWNHLLLTSVNGMTVTAATMSGLAGMSSGVYSGSPLLALKLSSALLYLAATGVLMVMNKIQPSQLAEEQRNASRLFKHLHEEIKTSLALKNPDSNEVKEIMEKVLALDRAYPLPLLGAMLDKFPKNVEPAVWWPKHVDSSRVGAADKKAVKNGWSEKLEEEMKGIVGVLKRKDTADYVRLSKVALMVSKVLATCGPVFTGLAAVGAACVGIRGRPWAVFVGVVFGSLATIVNTLEHGGQVGMVFEMYRSSAGFYRLMEESIESTLHERKDRRENGDLFEAKVALDLGRNLSELRNLASASSSSSFSSRSTGAIDEFASKLF
ncbi:hypothetical protein RJ640_004719 [Escallonia rubra]|uniref:F-box protein n=1 Tax=Escallonia rubra TaxID=112253 RepID=A0AA88S134_9ASTE|nr:hypothetical protein RJ640_004719 [Escallonia rubra]